MRFVENHDEPRAAADVRAGRRSGRRRSSIATLPGATLWHEGQFEGWTRAAAGVPRPPAGRSRSTRTCAAFHLRLVAAAAQVRRGDWQLCEASGWPEDPSYDQLARLVLDRTTSSRSLVVVNLADAPAAAHVHLPWPDLAGRTWRLEDLLSGDVFERDGDETATAGLYVDLPPRGTHVMAWSPRG